MKYNHNIFSFEEDLARSEKTVKEEVLPYFKNLGFKNPRLSVGKNEKGDFLFGKDLLVEFKEDFKAIKTGNFFLDKIALEKSESFYYLIKIESKFIWIKKSDLVSLIDDGLPVSYPRDGWLIPVWLIQDHSIDPKDLVGVY